MNIREISDNIWELKFGEDRISYKKLVINNNIREITLFRVENSFKLREFKEVTDIHPIRTWTISSEFSLQQFLTILLKALHM